MGFFFEWGHKHNDFCVQNVCTLIFPCDGNIHKYMLGAFSHSYPISCVAAFSSTRKIVGHDWHVHTHVRVHARARTHTHTHTHTSVWVCLCQQAHSIVNDLGANSYIFLLLATGHFKDYHNDQHIIYKLVQ